MSLEQATPWQTGLHCTGDTMGWRNEAVKPLNWSELGNEINTLVEPSYETDLWENLQFRERSGRKEKVGAKR